jgi:hypothetical protein
LVLNWSWICHSRPCFVRERASSVKHDRPALADRPAALYLPHVTEMPRI